MNNNDPKVSDLTVKQLQELIRETVQEAVAEVMIEFSVVAEVEEQLRYEAEMVDSLRSALHPVDFKGTTHLDD